MNIDTVSRTMTLTLAEARKFEQVMLMVDHLSANGEYDACSATLRALLQKHAAKHLDGDRVQPTQKQVLIEESIGDL